MAVITRSSYVLQTILAPKSKYTAKSAAKWISDHGYKTNKVDIDENYYRFRQRSPTGLNSYYTKTLDNGIKFVYARAKYAK